MSGANASLRAMFPDANPALLDRALEHCGGDVERAVDYLLANPPPPSAESASAPPQVHAQTVGGEAIAATVSPIGIKEQRGDRFGQYASCCCGGIEPCRVPGGAFPSVLQMYPAGASDAARAPSLNDC